ncbi:MAG: class I SAM-dependent methyltransferase [Promethearchaeota archaeon]
MGRFDVITIIFSAFRSYLFRRQEVIIEDIPSGRVLDIGGGGEGVIAQIGAERVTAIDKRESEIKDAQSKAPTANWHVADARDLSFEDESFNNATAFFSLMYMRPTVKKEVLLEVFRLLPPGGELWIWDANISSKGFFVIMLTIQLPNGKKIRTGYGSKDCPQSTELISELLQKTGFEVSEVESSKLWFFLKAKKPN